MGQIKNDYVNGSRFYFSTEDPSTRLPGVTSVLNTIPKDFLRWWSAKKAAERAVESVDVIKRMAEVNRDDAVKYLASAANSYTRSRSKIGSEAHDAFERMIRGESVGFAAKGTENHVRHFGEFLDRVQPELLRAEDVCWSSTHGYAGSADAFLRLKLNDQGDPDPQGEPATVVCDWKTGRETYPDVALQMSAYAHADKLIDPDGNSHPLPDVDGGMVLHVTEEKWALKPVLVGNDVFEMFKACLAFFTSLRTWDGEGKGRTRIPGLKERVIGKPIAGSDHFVSGTERRA